jgi:CHAT domain-containing protein
MSIPHELTRDSLHSILWFANLVAIASWNVSRVLGLGDTEHAAVAALAIATYKANSGQAEAAIPFVEQALRVRTKLFGASAPITVRTMSWWVRIHDAAGNKSHVYLRLQQAVDEIVPTPETLAEYCDLQDSLSQCYSTQGDVARAELLMNEAFHLRLKHLGWKNRGTMEAFLRILSAIHLPKGELDTVRSGMERVEALLEECSSEFWSRAVQYPLQMLRANLLIQTGEWNLAADAAKGALEAARFFRLPGDVRVGESVVLLGKILCHLGQGADVKQLLRDNQVDAYFDSFDARTRSDLLMLDFVSSMDAGDPYPMFDVILSAMKLASQAIEAERSASNEERLLTLTNEEWARLRHFLYYAAQVIDELSTAQVEELYTLVLLYKGKVCEAICVNREQRLADKYPAYQSDLRRLSVLRQLLQIAEPAQSKGGPRNRLSAERKEYVKLHARLAETIPELILEYELMQASDIASALDEIDPFAVLIDFVRVGKPGEPDSDSLLVFVIPAVGVARMLLLPDWKRIAAAVRSYRESTLAEVHKQFRRAGLGRPAHKEIYDLLWRPVEEVIRRLPYPSNRRDIRKLYICPDDILCLLPFAALMDPDSEPRSYLLDRYEISMLSSARVLLEPAIDTVGASTALCIGLSSFAGPNAATASEEDESRLGLQFADIPAAEQEAELVAGIHQGELLSGPSHVTKQAVCERLNHIESGSKRAGFESPSVVHIASHGFVDCQAMGDGSPSLEQIRLSNRNAVIALAGAAGWRPSALGESWRPYPGVLSAQEVAGLDLRQTRLVVLSACDSGSGLPAAAEGVFGLQRAFSLAGARSLVMPLWVVLDHKTCRFMEDFHQRIARGESPAAALRQAQLKLRKTSPFPAIWGAFVVHGRADQIS